MFQGHTGMLAFFHDLNMWRFNSNFNCLFLMDRDLLLCYNELIIEGENDYFQM